MICYYPGMGSGAEIDNRDVAQEKAERDVKTRILNYGGTNALTVEEAAEKIGTEPQGIRTMVESGVILGLTDADDQLLVPSWQFLGERVQVIPEVPYYAAIAEDPWGIAGILTKSQPSLDGKVPIDVFRERDSKDVQRTRRFMKELVSDLYGLDESENLRVS